MRVNCNRRCQPDEKNLRPEATHYLDCTIWGWRLDPTPSPAGGHVRRETPPSATQDTRSRFAVARRCAVMVLLYSTGPVIMVYLLGVALRWW